MNQDQRELLELAAPEWNSGAEAMRWLNQVELVAGGSNGPTIKLRAAISAIIEELAESRGIMAAIISEPFGCPFCDSGKLRNPDKPHDTTCGFARAAAAIGKQMKEQMK